MNGQRMTCRYADLDGSYVLGALAPSERLEFEQHLAGCKECSRAVRDLAGLPGLLGRVDPSVLDDPGVDEPVPDTLLTNLVRDVRRQRRRRVVAGGLAAAAVAGVLALSLSGILTPDSPPSARAPAPVPTAQKMLPVGDVPVTADLALESVAWGTRLQLACTYAPDAAFGADHPAVTYALYVRTRDGHGEQVGTWRSLEDKTMRLWAATSARRNQIESVEVRTLDGRTVLRLTG